MFFAVSKSHKTLKVNDKETRNIAVIKVLRLDI